MDIVARLHSQTYLSYGAGLIGLGTPLSLFFECETLVARAYEMDSGWYERLGHEVSPALVQLQANRYAFCGQVLGIEEVIEDEEELFYFAVLDCGLPISIAAVDYEARPEAGDPGQQTPQPGAWLAGVLSLHLAWADQEAQAAAHALSASVMAIERRVLRPGPGFGDLRSEVELPHVVLDPDQVYLTLRVVNR